MYETECQCDNPEPMTNGTCANCGKAIPEMDGSLDGFENEQYSREDMNR